MESDKLRPLTPRPLTPRPLTPRPLTPRPLTHRPLTPRPLTPRPLTLWWLFLIVLQSIQLLTTVTFLYDPAITADFSIQGLNNYGHRATQIYACSGGMSCAQLACTLQQHPNVSSILLIPFEQYPPNTCSFSLLSAILATFSAKPTTIAMSFLVLAIGTFSIYLLVHILGVGDGKVILHFLVLSILGNAISVIVALYQFWIELPSVVKSMSIFLQCAVILFVIVERIFSIWDN